MRQGHVAHLTFPVAISKRSFSEGAQSPRLNDIRGETFSSAFCKVVFKYSVYLQNDSLYLRTQSHLLSKKEKREL